MADQAPHPRLAGLCPQEVKETRLRRLEELLLQRSRLMDQMDAPEDPPAQAGGRSGTRSAAGRSGFSLIELLIVLVIVMILIGFGLNTFADSMKRATVEQAAADILAASDAARQLALLGNGVGEVHYGVRLVDDHATRTAMVTVVTLENGTVAVAENDVGEPIYAAEIPASVVVWQGDQDLRSASETELVWFFGNGSGKVRMQDGNGLSTYPVGVGIDAPRVEEVWGLPENTGFVPAIAANSGATPGLSVRSTDNTYRVAISIHPNGVGHRATFGDEADQ